MMTERRPLSEMQAEESPILIDLCEDLPEVEVKPSDVDPGNKDLPGVEIIPSDVDPGDKENPPKARRSILKCFDPLYAGSPTVTKDSSSPLNSNKYTVLEEDNLLTDFETNDTTLKENEQIVQLDTTFNVSANKSVADATLTFEDNELNTTYNLKEETADINKSKCSIVQDSLLDDITTNVNELTDAENATPYVNRNNDSYIAEAVLDPEVNNGYNEIKVDENSLQNIETNKNLVLDKDSDNLGTIANNLVKVTSNKPRVRTMSDPSDTINHHEQDICDLKLQLNHSQQAKASLELQIRQKEELIIKIQAEGKKKELTLHNEIKQLQEKLNCKEDINEQDSKMRDLQEALTQAKTKNEQILDQLKAKTAEAAELNSNLEEYEKQFKTQLEDLERIKQENGTLRRHLTNSEISFSDVHQKYEKCKMVVEAFKSNESVLLNNMKQFEEQLKIHENKYDTLKAHAKTQIEKCNFENCELKDKYDHDVVKLNAIIKRLQIKLDSITNSLNQKTNECEGLAKLCDELTGKVN